VNKCIRSPGRAVEKGNVTMRHDDLFYDGMTASVMPFDTCQTILTGARHDSGFVQNAPRRRSRLGGTGGFAAIEPARPRSETLRPEHDSSLTLSDSVPSACHSSKRRRQVGGDG
jgi:hypothetical protein